MVVQYGDAKCLVSDLAVVFVGRPVVVVLSVVVVSHSVVAVVPVLGQCVSVLGCRCAVVTHISHQEGGHMAAASAFLAASIGSENGHIVLC